jgi:hypothetical protein
MMKGLYGAASSVAMRENLYLPIEKSLVRLVRTAEETELVPGKG